MKHRAPPAIFLLIAALASGACLGPQVSGAPAASSSILAAGSVVPAIDDDAMLAAQVKANDGIGGQTVPLYSGFVAGGPVSYWALGPAPPFAAPIYILERRGADGNLTPIAHPPIITTLPGDLGYTPFRNLVTVEVTAAYAGQVLPSAQAVDDAVDAGLVLAPVPDQTAELFLVADPAALIALGDGTTRAPDHPFYCRGVAGMAYDFGPVPGASGADIPTQDHAVLAREGEPPLSEPVRHVDMDGDGDTDDTNDIFALPHGDASYTPSCQPVNVTVLPGTNSIDTSQDQTKAELTSITQLFVGEPGTRDPVVGTVIAFDVAPQPFLCPQLADLVSP